MKRKLFATALAATTALTCALSLSACGGGGAPEPSALENAYQNFDKTQNMTVTVTDNRTEKIGNDYSALVKVDYENGTAYAKHNSMFVDSQDGIVSINTYDSYYEIDGNEKTFFIYSKYQGWWTDGENEYFGDPVWSTPLDRSDLFNDDFLQYHDTQTEYEIHLLCDWVRFYLPSYGFYDTGWRETENSSVTWAELHGLLDAFTESPDGYTASLYFCINDEGVYIPYACNVTIKLDGQDRFENVVLDFGANGTIEAEYSYGTTNVTVPEEAKNVNPNS